MLWSGPIVLDQTGQVLTDVACPSASQCTAVDTGGHQVTFNPTAPGTPTPTTIDAGHWLTGVACPSASQCTAVDTEGHQVTFNPTAPGTPTPTTIDAGHWLKAVACPSVEQCTAVDTEGQQVTFNPNTPGTPAPTSIASGPLDDVACPSTSQCTGIYDNNQVTFNPNTSAQTGWRILSSSTYALNGGVACPSTGQCTAVGGHGQVVTFDPTRGVLNYTALPTEWLEGVTCPSTDQCTAVGHSSPVFEGDPNTPASWHLESIAGTSSLTDVDCSSAMQCVAVDGTSAFLGTRAHTLTVALAGNGSVTGPGISCPGTCSALFATGTLVTLTANAAAGFSFTGWSGGGCSGAGTCTVTMGADQGVTATFTATPVSPSPSVTSSPPVTPGAVQQTAKVQVPKKILYMGRTVLLNKAVRTNAEQKATSKVTVKPKGSKYSQVKTTSKGRVTIRTLGKKKLKVTLKLTAPASGQYGPYSFTKKWTVKR